MFLCANINFPEGRNVRLLCKALIYLYLKFTKWSFSSQRDLYDQCGFAACFEWLNEDRQSHGLGLTPNFELTGYKTHCLLYYGGARELKTERDTNGGN